MLKITEAKEQEALFEWASFYPDIYAYLLHIPNGGRRFYLEARALKRRGVKPGISDIFFAYPVSPYAGLWIELKAKQKHKITESQIEWIYLMRKVGYCAEIAVGWIEARDMILKYLVGWDKHVK